MNENESFTLESQPQDIDFNNIALDNINNEGIDVHFSPSMNSVFLADERQSSLDLMNSQKKKEEKNPTIKTEITIPKKEKEKENSLSEDCYSGTDIAPAELLKEIISIKSAQILEPLLMERKRWFKKLSAEEILKWQKREIVRPLLIMKTVRDFDSSIQMFRNLLSYMKDRKSSKASSMHVKKFIKLVLKGGEILRDEAFLQVYKQLNDNKKNESFMRGLKMMAIISSCFVPKNPDVYKFILNYLFFQINNYNNKDKNILNHLNYIFARMIKTKDHERRFVPCETELNNIECLTSILVSVNFFNDAKKNIKVESYTTMGDLKKTIMNILNFNSKRAIYYTMYEICTKENTLEERFIDDSEKVCDILSVWNSEKDKSNKNGEKCDFKFYIRLLIYYPFTEDEVDTLSIVYYQTVYDVITGKHPLDLRKILTLASLELVNECGNDEEKAKELLSTKLNKFIPFNNFNEMSEEEWKEKILTQYVNISEISKNNARWNYLQELSNLHTFQTQQFYAKFNYIKSGTNEDGIPDICILGFRPDGIMIMDEEKKEIIFYKYETIMNWGISRTQLILCLSTNANEIHRVCFMTSQTKVIQTLIEIYCNIFVGKTIKEIQKVVEDYDTKFKSIDCSRRKNSLLYKEQKTGNILNESKINEIDESVYEINKKDKDTEKIKEIGSILPDNEKNNDE